MRLTWTPVRPGPGDDRRSWRCRGRREAVLLKAAGRTDSVLHDPKPFVLQTQLGDLAATYGLD
jgi:hypothetical protein